MFGHRIKYNKYLIIVFLAIFIIFILIGCNGAKSKSYVQEDVENHALWQGLHVQTTEFDIVKRQTNKREKEDIIFISMKGENELCVVERYYKATYHLYNEGWVLDELVESEDEIYSNIVKPTKSVDYKQVKELADSISIWDYGSFEPSSSDGVWQVSHPAEVSDEIEEVEFAFGDNYGRNTYLIQCIYHCGIFNEMLKLPLVFEFQYIDSETGYGWIGNVDECSAERTVELSDGILGEWIDSYWEEPFYAKVTFSELQGNSCQCEFSSFTYNGSIYITGNKNYSGKVTLNYDLDSETGLIDDMVLKFDSDQGEFEISSGDGFLMSAWGTTGGYVVAHRPLVFKR